MQVDFDNRIPMSGAAVRVPSRFLLCAAALLSFGISAFAVPSVGSETVGANNASGVVYINGAEANTAGAVVQSAERAWLEVRQGDFGTLASLSDVVVANTNFSTSVIVPMSGSIRSGRYSCSFPPLNEGKVWWRVVAEDAAGNTTKGVLYSATVTNSLQTVLPPARKPDFADFRTNATLRAFNRLGGSSGANGANITDDWAGNKVSMRVPGNSVLDLPGITPPSASASYSSDTMGAWIRTRAGRGISGIGSIWFKARYIGTNATPRASLAVQIGYRSGLNYQWTDIETIEFAPESVGGDVGKPAWKQFRIDVDTEEEGRYVRFKNVTEYEYIDNASERSTFENQNTIEIADIVITPISPDVTVSKDPLDYSPGYPNMDDPVTFRVSATNKWESAPAANITPRLVWRIDGGAWNETVMTNVLGWTSQGSDGEYTCTLSGLPSGIFEYFHRVDFAGKAATWPHEADLYADGGVSGVSDGVENATDYAMWTWADGYTRESRSPAYGPDFAEAYGSGAHYGYQNWAFGASDRSYLFDIYGEAGTGEDIFWPKAINGPKGRDSTDNPIGAIYPVADAWELYGETPAALEYDYRSFQAEEGIRRFRSLYDKVSLVTAVDHLTDENNPYAGSHLEPEYAMQQVGDYTWQAIVRVTNAVDVAFSVTTTDYFDEDSPSAYAKGSGAGGAFPWGQVDQSEGDIYPPMADVVERADQTGDYDPEEVPNPDGTDEPVPRVAEPVHVQIDYDGFLMFRFCTTNGEYQIRRAAWQDFNDWQADDTRYGQSYGLYGASIFSVISSNLVTSAFGCYSNAYVQPSPITVPTTHEDDMLDSRGTSVGGLLLRNAWVQDTKGFVETNAFISLASQTHLRTYRLSGAKSYLGSFETVGDDFYRGGRESFAVRVRSSSDDDRFALYRNTPDPATGNGYRVVAYVAGPGDKGDSTNSVSAIGFWQDDANYWEARVAEGRRHALASGRIAEYPTLRLEIILVENGVRRVVSAREIVNSNNNNAELRVGDCVVLWLRRSGAGVIAKAQCFRGMSESFQGNVIESWSNPLGADTAITTSVTNGLAGFNTREWGCQIEPYIYPSDTSLTAINLDSAIKRTGSTADAYRAMSVTAADSAWNLSRRREWGYVSPWTINVPTGTPEPARAPVTFSKAPPRVFYRLLANRTGKDEAEGQYLATADSADFSSIWAEDWDEHEGHTFDGVMSVQSYAWQTNTFPLHFWDDSFVRLEVLADDGSGATSPATTQGDLSVEVLPSWEWRGSDIYDRNSSYESDGVRANDAWHGSRSAFVREGLGSVKWDLDFTRAESVSDVYIDSPFLQNGIGDLTFTWTAPAPESTYTNHPVILSVERRDESNSSGEVIGVVTTLVDSVTSQYSVFSGSVRIACLTNNVSGRLRIQPLPWEVNGTNYYGRVRVDNLRATDYPASGDTSWEGYNILVSTFTTSDELRRLKFDGYSSRFDSCRSAVLNDGNAKETLPEGFVFDEHLPFVQTPSIQTGVGEISFWYRGHPDNGDETASLSLQVATRTTPTDEDWVVLTPDRLDREDANYAEQVAALAALANITTNAWTYFNAEFFEKEYPLLRIYSTSTNGHNRVMLDNVLVTEPVRAGIDVGDIFFVPDIPLASSEPYGRVSLVNPRMRPEITSVELQWYAGTNLWGWSEWKDSPAAGRVTMSPSPTDKFLYVADQPLPRYPVDTVVQYCAIVSFTGKGGASKTVSAEQVRSGESANIFEFKNPSWYEPVDLNAQFGTTNPPVTVPPVAHYWVFSTPTNSVFINEIAPAYRNYTTATRQFVELIGPQDASIGDWTLTVPDSAVEARPLIDTVKFRHVVPSEATLKADPDDTSGKGWGFWVFGAPDIAARDQPLFTDEITRGVVDQTVTPSEYYWTLYTPGALELRRSMGAYVDRVCWAKDDQSEVADFIARGYRYLGTKSARSQAAFAWNDDEENGYLVWSTLSFFSPGQYNLGQSASIWTAPGAAAEPEEPEDPPEIDNLRIISFMMYDPEIFDEAEGVLYSQVEIQVAFTITNGSSLRQEDFEWVIEMADTLEDLSNPNMVEVFAIGGADDGSGNELPSAEAGTTDVEFTVTISPGCAEDVQSRFFRVRAIPLDR